MENNYNFTQAQPDISVICVFNDTGKIDKMLINSLKKQEGNYEIIAIDNTDKKYPSAAIAFNRNIQKAKWKYVLFAHQDVCFIDNKTLKLMMQYGEDLGGSFIAGVAGSKKKGQVITNITHGVPPCLAGNKQIETAEEVQTLDECCFMIKKDMFRKLSFDETVCKGWHLYCVDYCLSAKMLGWQVYVLPLEIYHESDGASFSKAYYADLFGLAKKYMTCYRYMYTTMGGWSTNKIKLTINIIESECKKHLLHFKAIRYINNLRKNCIKNLK